ncbi:hypothetical protein R6Q59_010818 [Mikania micrantha]
MFPILQRRSKSGVKRFFVLTIEIRDETILCVLLKVGYDQQSDLLQVHFRIDEPATCVEVELFVATLKGQNSDPKVLHPRLTPLSDLSTCNWFGGLTFVKGLGWFVVPAKLLFRWWLKVVVA